MASSFQPLALLLLDRQTGGRKSKAQDRGGPYRQGSFCNGAEYANGPIRFRQQLSFSTSSSALILRRQVQYLRSCVFRRSRGGRVSQDGQTEDGFAVVNSSFCSGPFFSLVRTAFCNRVEHSDGVAAALPGRKGTHEGRSYRQDSFCNGVEHANGPIRFRQQLSLSTSGGVLSLRRQVERLRGCVFPVTRRPGSQTRTGRSVVVNSSFYSDLTFSLVRTAFCNRVEHSDGVAAALPGRKGTHEGRPYRQDSLCNGVEHANGPIRFRQQLSLSTSGGVLSLESEVERLRGCVFPQSRGSRVPKGRADRFRCRQQFFLFWSVFFSGRDGVLQQGRTFRRGCDGASDVRPDSKPSSSHKDAGAPAKCVPTLRHCSLDSG